MNDEVAKLLNGLAAKLGIAVDHLWAILVRQSYIEFWLETLTYAFLGVGCYLAVKFARKF